MWLFAMNGKELNHHQKIALFADCQRLTMIKRTHTIIYDQHWSTMSFDVFCWGTIFRQKLSAEEPTIALPKHHILWLAPGHGITIPLVLSSVSHDGSMYAIYGNMDPINIPQMLAYIYHTWILWVWLFKGVVRGAIDLPTLAQGC